MTTLDVGELRRIIIRAMFDSNGRVAVDWETAHAAAERIAELLPKPAKPLPAAFYPNLACDCGAARVGTSKHAGWCSLNGPRNGGRR